MQLRNLDLMARNFSLWYNLQKSVVYFCLEFENLVDVIIMKLAIKSVGFVLNHINYSD